MFESIKKKVTSFVQKARRVLGSPKIWGTVAVFSPTLVACYGMPFDYYDSDAAQTYVYEKADCIDGYIQLVQGTIITDYVYDVQTEKLEEKTDIKCTESETSEQMICTLCARDASKNPVCYADCRSSVARDCSDMGTCTKDCSDNGSEICNPSCDGGNLIIWNRERQQKVNMECEGECVQDEHFAWCRYKDSAGKTDNPENTEDAGEPGPDDGSGGTPSE